MKTHIKTTLSRIGLLTAVMIIAGCNEEEPFSRYPSLEVPVFGTDEYINDLSSPDPELVYSAVCNLGPQAGNFSKTLNKEDADPASSEYQQAEAVYQAVCREVDSKDALLAAVSLHFLQKFASNHKNKAELLEVALRIQSDHPQVKYEQTVLLQWLADEEESDVPDSLLKELMKNRSWIVSRTAYGLIGMLKHEPLRRELIVRYQDTEDVREQLVIIEALGRQLQPEEARLFETDMLTTTNALIREAAMDTLMYNLDVSNVRKSLIDHYADFTPDEQTDLFDECEDIELACGFLEQGFVPTDETLKSILKDLLNEEHTEEECDLDKLDRALSAAPKTAERWRTLKEEAEQNRQKMAEAREEAKPISKAFADQMLALRDKHGLNDSEMEKIWEVVGKKMEASEEKTMIQK